MRPDARHHPRQAVVFGAGNMACALIGELLFEAGFETLFVARGRNIAQLNRQEGYAVGLVGQQSRWKRVRRCSALPISESDVIADAVAAADIVFTAVGIDNIPAIAPVLAEGLSRRLSRPARPLNVIAAENLPGAGAYLRHQIVCAAPLEKALLLNELVGFSAALTHRIMTGGEIVDGLLHFTVDAPGDLILDRRGLIEPLPRIAHTFVSDEFDALFLEKLATTNLAQAVASYLGHREACSYVHEAATHAGIAPAVEAAVAEAAAALRAEFPELEMMVSRDARLAVARIADPGLRDPIERICRGPMRKLGARERLIAPARLAAKHGLPHANLVKAIAAALAYDNEHDVQARMLQYIIAEEGVEYVLTAICGLLPHEPLAQEIKLEWAALMRNALQGSRRLGHRAIIEQLVREAVEEMADQIGAVDVDRCVDEISEEFGRARVTLFLPVLVKKRLSGRLGSKVAPPAHLTRSALAGRTVSNVTS